MATNILQITEEPIQTTLEFDQFVSEQSHHQSWADAVVLSSTEVTLVLLLDPEDGIIQVLRICFDDEPSTTSALKRLNNNKAKIRCGKVERFNSTNDLEELKSVLTQCSIENLTLKKAYSSFFDHKKTGRGRAISAATARNVTFESHGYCMFEGCGLNLRIDELTGVKGNFNYLAHIVASSPDGPRGNSQSHDLSDDASNIMILCDKHHRLIDKVAVNEYPEQRLIEMKASFKKSTDFFLQGLMHQEVPTYTAFWPIGGTLPEDPSPQEYAVSLHPINCRPSRVHRQLIELRPQTQQDENWWSSIAPYELNETGRAFKSYSENDRHKAGIYALGPSSMMIGLGSVLGNKNSLCIIPKSRVNGWGWNRQTPLKEPFKYNFESVGIEKIDEVAITLFFTAIPSESDSLARYFEENKIPVININASKPGNESLAHHEEGLYLREMLVNLFHDLRNRHAVKLIHFIHCASNAACVEAGRAMEHNHPRFRIYEHHKSQTDKYFVPRLDILPSDNQVIVEATDINEVSKFHKLSSSR